MTILFTKNRLFFGKCHKKEGETMGKPPSCQGAAFHLYLIQESFFILNGNEAVFVANQNFWEILQQKRSGLTKSGRIVADYLTQHAEDAQYLSISSLARACNVAEATIFRFCRALGFEGYNEMKISLAQANAVPGYFTAQTLEPGTSTETLFEHAAAAFAAAVNGTRSVLDTAAVDTAATLLQRARQVFCFGQGGSGRLADEIWARFATISTKFRTAGDSHMELTTASLLGPEYVILFVSYSGATRDMMDTLKTARANGVKIILITHFDDAPGTSLADVVLLCGARESPLDAGSIPVKASVLYVAEVLVLRFSLDNQELTSLSRERVSHALSAKLL